MNARKWSPLSISTCDKPEVRANSAKNGKGSLRTPIALLFALLAAPVAFGHQQKIYELKGDALGETLAAFKERHPQVHCTRYDDVTISCSDKDGSFAGHSPF